MSELQMVYKKELADFLEMKGHKLLGIEHEEEETIYLFNYSEEIEKDMENFIVDQGLLSPFID